MAKYESRLPVIGKIKVLLHKKSYLAARNIVTASSLDEDFATLRGSRGSTSHSTAATDRTQSSQRVLDLPAAMGSSIETPEQVINFIRSVRTAERSEEGVFGVILCDTAEQRRVLKFTDHPENVVLADRVFSSVGLMTPLTTGFSRESEQAKAIRDMVGAHFTAPLPDHIRDSIDTAKATKDERFTRQVLAPLGRPGISRKQYQVQAQSQLNTHILYMNNLKGVSWAAAAPGQKEKALKDPTFIRDIGKMVLLDIIMGNPDRLDVNKFNDGNIMLVNGKPALIDNEVGLNPDEFGNYEQKLRKLFSNDGLQICEALAGQIAKGMPNISQDTLRSIRDGIYEEIKIAAREFLSQVGNDLISDTINEFPQSNSHIGLILNMKAILREYFT